MSRMDPKRLQKIILLAELWKKRPFHGTTRRWKDLVSSDLVELGVKQKWYEYRKAWFDCVRTGWNQKSGKD